MLLVDGYRYELDVDGALGYTDFNIVFGWQTFMGFTDDTEWSLNPEEEAKAIPIFKVACSKRIASQTRLELHGKKAGRNQLLWDGYIDDEYEDYFLRALAPIQPVHQFRKNDPQSLLHECSLRRFSQNNYTFFLDVAVFKRNTPEIPMRHPTFMNQLFDNAFPGLEEAVQDDHFPPRQFYSSVHVPSKEDTPTIHSDVLTCELFPFQRRAVKWLLDREGVDLLNDGTISKRPPSKSMALPPSFCETLDADGKKCYASPYLRVLTSDLTDCWNAYETLRGGILAEEMGLGKTVEMISLITLHKRDMEHKYEHHDLIASDGRPLTVSGATLIVTPSVIESQWKSEFERHAPRVKVCYYEGINSNKSYSTEDWIKELLEYDVVVISYNVLGGEIHYSEDPPDRALRHKKKNPLRRSPLVQISWWRVCLDEAQMVESGVTHAAKVARVIPRVNAWAITGTPLRKDMDDLFGLLLFLHYEPFCFNSKLWRRLHRSFHPLLKEIIGKITLRHSKDLIRNEIEIPAQKRYVIKIPFTPVEESNYRSLFAQMCHECGLDSTGGPKSDDWDPDSRDVIDSMRRWLSRLRQACLRTDWTHGAVTAPSNDTSLKSVAEVLESMIDLNENDIFNEEKKFLLAMIRRGQLLENALDPKGALGVWQEALKYVTPVVTRYKEELRVELEKRRQRRREERKQKKAGKPAVESDDEDDDDDDNDRKSGAVHRAKKRAKNRLLGAYARVRSALEVQHMCHFFIGNAFYQIKTNTDLTKPDSEEYRALEKSEAKAYEDAKQVRKELLAEANKVVSKVIGHLRDLVEHEGLVSMPDMQLDIEGVGIESELIVDRFDSLCEFMNQHATFYSKLRGHLIKMLLAQLVDQDDDAELEGNEYEVSAKHQDELYVYMETIRVMSAYRLAAITGQRNDLISRDVAQGLALAKDGQGPCPELYLKLMHECNRFEPGVEFDPLRTIVSDLRNMVTSLEWQSNAGETRAQFELAIIRPLVTQAIEIYAAQSKTLPELEQEVRTLSRVMNKRLEFYRQLQQISDMVAPYAEETKGQPLDKYSYDRQVNLEKEVESKVSSLKSKLRYLIYLRDDSESGEDSRLCVICQSQIEVGVLTVCGHKYCKDCYHIWWRQHRSCPTCKRRLTATESHSISFKPQELVAEEERPPETLGHSSATENPIYTDASKGVLNEVMSIKLGHSFGTKIDTIAKHLIWLRRHDPGSKSVVFSQYSSFIWTLTEAFKKFGIGCAWLSGDGLERFRRDASVSYLCLDETDHQHVWSRH